MAIARGGRLGHTPRCAESSTLSSAGRRVWARRAGEGCQFLGPASREGSSAVAP